MSILVDHRRPKRAVPGGKTARRTRIIGALADWSRRRASRGRGEHREKPKLVRGENGER